MTTILMNALNAHPWLIGFIIAWITLFLHLPYRVEVRRTSRGVYGVWQSLLYRFEYGPTYQRLNYNGLRHLQRVVIGLLREVWGLLRGDMVRRLVDELRRWLEI